jgi:hypothetical protein
MPRVSPAVGTEYAHGGLSLQECLVPVIALDVAASASPAANVQSL